MEDNFKFNSENLKKAERIIARYPSGRQASAILPLLDLAQRQAGGWLPGHVVEYVADLLEMPYMRAFEVASFYSMFNLKPVGNCHVQVCTTTPCWLKGSDAIVQACEEVIGIKCGETSADGKFSLMEVECLGACVDAPVVQINDEYFENLTAEEIKTVLAKIR